jgi:hypothetical protein
VKKYNSVKNKLIEKIEIAKNKNKRLENLALTANLFDYRANLVKQKKREYLRARMELGRLSNEENKQLNYLKLQNKISSDFVRFSKGEKRIFINSRSSDNFDINSIKHYNNFKKRKIIINNKNKMRTLMPIYSSDKKEEISSNMDTNNDIKIYKKWIRLNKVKSFENVFSSYDIDINDKGKIYTLKKSTEGTSSIYKSN